MTELISAIKEDQHGLQLHATSTLDHHGGQGGATIFRFTQAVLIFFLRKILFPVGTTRHFFSSSAAKLELLKVTFYQNNQIDLRI